MKNKIKVRASASIANISCGFDCLGLSIKEPYDEVTLEFNNSKKLSITVSGKKSSLIPVNPEKNTAGKAILSFLHSIGEKKGLNISEPEARRHVYGMPYEDWKKNFQK